MFCKNCGSALKENDERCDVCQYKVGFGNHFCAYCGAEIAEGTDICPQCGNSTGQPSAPQKEQPRSTNPPTYTRYAESFRKINILELCVQGLSLLLVLFMVFLPIYRCKYKVDLDDIKNMEEWEMAWKNDGCLEKDFSLFDDIKRIAAVFTDDEKESASPSELIVFLYGLFALFEIVFAVICAFVAAKKIYEKVCSLSHPNDDLLLYYNEIKKNGFREQKVNFMKQQSVYSLIMFAFGDVLFTKLYGKILDLPDAPESLGVQRYMMSLTGPSSSAFILAIALVALVVVNIIKNKAEKELKLRIAREER